MALSPDTVYEVRTDGHDNNGGGFVPTGGGGDFSQQAAPQKTGSDLAVHGTDDTKVRPVAAGVDDADVNNLVKISAGTGWTIGRYRILSHDAYYWTLDRSPTTAGNGNPATYRMGGALLSPGELGYQIYEPSVGGGVDLTRTQWIRQGTYTLGTGAAASKGRFYVGGNLTFFVEGYGTTRGDLGGPPVMHAGTITDITTGLFGFDIGYNAIAGVRNLTVNGNNGANNRGFFAGAWFSKYLQCQALNCPGDGGFVRGTPEECYAENCQRGYYFCYAAGCVAKGCSYGFYNTAEDLADCIALDGTTGFYFANHTLRRCLAYGNSGQGFQSSRGGFIVDSLAVQNGGYGYYAGNASLPVALHNCYSYLNTSGQTFGTWIPAPPTELSGPPFIDAPGGDFRLNEAAGSPLRGAALAAWGQTNNRDVCPVQHADAELYYRRRDRLFGA